MLCLVSFILIFSIIREKIEENLNQKTSSKNNEFVLLVLFGSLLFSIIISSHDLFITYLALEGLSLLITIFIIGYGPIFKSSEASIKYFSISAFTAGFVLYGISIIYKKIQTTNYTEIYKYALMCVENSRGEDISWLTVSLIFIMAGFFFKLTVAPFHLWATEVYGNIPIVTAAFIFLPYKFSLLVAFFKITAYAFYSLSWIWSPILLILSITCIFWGSVGAVYEDKIKKFLVFASINQTGFIFLGLGSGTFYGISASLLHLVFYFLSTGALFLFLIGVKLYNNDTKSTFIHQLQYLYIPKAYALFLIPVVFSMAGFPPLFGFFTKYFLLLETFNTSGISFVILVLLLNILSAFYYFRLIKNTFFFSLDKEVEDPHILGSRTLEIISSILFIFCSLALCAGWVYLPNIVQFFDMLTENLLYPFFSHAHKF